MRRRNIGSHVEDLADGRMVAPGGFIDLNDEPQTTKLPKDATDEDRAKADAAALAASWAHPHNARLVDEGIMIDAPEKPAAPATTEKEG